MILVDTSIWIDHFRNDNAHLKELLVNGHVAYHPFVIGELACGHLKRRQEILTLLRALPKTDTLDDQEVLYFIEERQLMGLGIGLVDVHLLASALLTPCVLWTADKNLRRAAERLHILYSA